MSRPIKFRVWNKNHEDFETGWVFPAAFTDPAFALDTPEEYAIMQFVGMLDKNGKEIYEDDIVEIDGFGRCRVVYLTEAMKFFFLSLKPEAGAFTAVPEIITVIGNVYENSDLLI